MTVETIAPTPTTQPATGVGPTNGVTLHLNGKPLAGKSVDSHQNGRNAQGETSHLPLPVAKKRRGKPLQALPTFPLEVGWREVFDPATGHFTQVPLTLLDLLYPEEKDIGLVVMTQGPIHDRWSRRFAETFAAYLAAEGWLVMHDVQIEWHHGLTPPRSPDVTLIAGGQLPAEGQESYHVGRDGPLPDFIIEITSGSTRLIDLTDKPLLYATVGIPELLIIDKGTPLTESWLLRGYRLGNAPTYEEFFADETGRITFEWVGLQFEVEGRQRVNVYDLATGARWLIHEEQKVRADEAEALAEQERIRADRAEALAEQERVRADEAAAFTEQERVRAAAAEALTEQERIRAAEAEAIAEQERVRAEQERLVRQDVEGQVAKMRAQLLAMGIEPE